MELPRDMDQRKKKGVFGILANARETPRVDAPKSGALREQKPKLKLLTMTYGNRRSDTLVLSLAKRGRIVNGPKEKARDTRIQSQTLCTGNRPGRTVDWLGHPRSGR